MIHVGPALRTVNARMIELLESFSPADWQRPTVHPNRDVKDLVAHMLDGSMRRLAFQRDGYATPPPEIRSYQDLVDFIQKINREWMTAARRLSPRMLIELTRQYDDELATFFESLDPHAEAPFAVAWAGDERSPMWFDVARDYTEKWHHQMQLRDATKRPALYSKELLMPLIETFSLGWAHAFRGLRVANGTRVRISITGPVNVTKALQRTDNGWAVGESGPLMDASVALDADVAWRLWTKGMDPAAAKASAVINGDASLVEPLFHFTAIMA
jgi:hypothetical protein